LTMNHDDLSSVRWTHAESASLAELFIRS
jgi:hypothetical protein